jgi:hypothetical protein
MIFRVRDPFLGNVGRDLQGLAVRNARTLSFASRKTQQKCRKIVITSAPSRASVVSGSRLPKSPN